MRVAARACEREQAQRTGRAERERIMAPASRTVPSRRTVPLMTDAAVEVAQADHVADAAVLQCDRMGRDGQPAVLEHHQRGLALRHQVWIADRR